MSSEKPFLDMLSPLSNNKLLSEFEQQRQSLESKPSAQDSYSENTFDMQHMLDAYKRY